MNLLTRKAILIALVFTIFSCSSDDDVAPINEEEVINQVNLRFTDEDNVLQTFVWNEGQGAATQITLTPNTTYSVDVQFLDVSDPSDVEDITEEVIEEADEHFVTYAFLNSGITLNRATNDITNADGQAIGIRTQWATADAGNGQVNVRLVHEPQTVSEQGDGGQGGTVTGGETDVDVNFTIAVAE